MVSRLLSAAMRQRECASRPAGYDSSQAQSVAMTPVGMPRRVVTSRE